MRVVDYKDSRGFLTKREVKDDDGEERYRYGIVIGPPDFDSADGLAEWPEEVRRRLNNELFHRNIITFQDAVRRRGEVLNALQSALRLDVETILVAYKEG